MTHLAERAQRALDIARDAHEPSRADFERVRSALRERYLADPGLFAPDLAQASSGVVSSLWAKAVAPACVGAALGLGTVAGVVALGAPSREVKPTPGVVSAPAVSSAPTIDRLPALPDEVVADQGAPLSPPPADRPLRGPPSPRSTAAGEVRTAPAPSNLEREIALLRRAQERLHRPDPRGALEALRELDLEIPRGALMEEREATRVIGVCALDPTQSTAVAFHERFPGSIHAARVRKACRESGPASDSSRDASRARFPGEVGSTETSGPSH